MIHYQESSEIFNLMFIKLDHRSFVTLAIFSFFCSHLFSLLLLLSRNVIEIQLFLPPDQFSEHE
jgi:hypothetical protein